MNDFLQIILSRRSIRKFLRQPVPAELLDQLLQAGMSAPSASNSQPWEFVVITTGDALARLRQVLPFGKFAVPAVIVVCGNPLKAHNPSGLLFWQQDCSAATQNILLAAHALGLGACWVGIHPIPLVSRSIRKVLGLPPWVKPLCAIYLGYPEHPKNPKSKYDPDRIHYNHYREQANPAESNQ
jgi:nitroreductase